MNQASSEGALADVAMHRIMDKHLEIAGSTRHFKTLNMKNAPKFNPGEKGTSLDQVVAEITKQYENGGLISEEVLKSLSEHSAELDLLMTNLGETRPFVNLVAHTADGGFTRMLLRREGNHYIEIDKGVSGATSEKKNKGYVMENDIFVSEEGAQAVGPELAHAA